MKTIFIGSTISDLHDYRVRVEEALKLENLSVHLSEDGVGGYDDTIARCRQRLHQTDGYLGIFAYFYGSMPPGYDRSITHLEFHWSLEKWGALACPRIAVFMPGTAYPLPVGQECEANRELRQKAAACLAQLSKEEQFQHETRLQRFHQEVTQAAQWRTVNWFRDLAELLVRATHTCRIWRGDLLAIADAGAGHFLDAVLKLPPLGGGRPPRRLRPPMPGYGLPELIQSVASEVVADVSDHRSIMTLDQNDSDLRQFLSYLIAALENVSPGACPDTRDLLSGPELAPIAVVGGHLINDLDALDEPYVIVLDDYHRLERSSPVHELLGMLLEYPPPDMHLALVTRIDPPLRLTSLRAGNRVVEIRLEDLRFTRSETSEFLSMKLDRQVTDAAIDNLQREVEGWAAGLRLVCLALRYASEPDAVLCALRGGIPQTQEYLLIEVLKELSPGVRDYLLKSSILDGFCAELIEVVCSADSQQAPRELSGQSFIDLLQHDNLFSISLDAEGRWFRYHHLFQSILQRQLELGSAPGEIEQLHLRAGAWLEARSLSSGQGLTGTLGDELALDLGGQPQHRGGNPASASSRRGPYPAWRYGRSGGASCRSRASPGPEASSGPCG